MTQVDLTPQNGYGKLEPAQLNFLHYKDCSWHVR